MVDFERNSNIYRNHRKDQYAVKKITSRKKKKNRHQNRRKINGLQIKMKEAKN
jgi:hypothetical protein